MGMRCPDFDAATLEALAGDDPRQLQRFYALFRAVCRWQHDGLVREVSQGHLEEAGFCARRLKVACFTVGALTLGHGYSRIESIANRWDAVELRESLADIEPHLEHVLASLGDLAEGIARTATSEARP